MENLIKLALEKNKTIIARGCDIIKFDSKEFNLKKELVKEAFKNILGFQSDSIKFFSGLEKTESVDETGNTIITDGQIATISTTYSIGLWLKWQTPRDKVQGAFSFVVSANNDNVVYNCSIVPVQKEFEIVILANRLVSGKTLPILWLNNIKYNSVGGGVSRDIMVTGKSLDFALNEVQEAF